LKDKTEKAKKKATSKETRATQPNLLSRSFDGNNMIKRKLKKIKKIIFQNDQL
jgi:hypothetical protein